MVNAESSVLGRLRHDFLSELEQFFQGVNIFHFGEFLLAELLFQRTYILAVGLFVHPNFLGGLLRHLNVATNERLKCGSLEFLCFLL